MKRTRASNTVCNLINIQSCTYNETTKATNTIISQTFNHMYSMKTRITDLKKNPVMCLAKATKLVNSFRRSKHCS